MNISYHLLIVTNDFDIACFFLKAIFNHWPLGPLAVPLVIDSWSIYFLMSVHLGSACINWPMAIILHANIDTNRSKCRIVRMKRKKETKHSGEIDIRFLSSALTGWPHLVIRVVTRSQSSPKDLLNQRLSSHLICPRFSGSLFFLIFFSHSFTRPHINILFI